MDTTYLRVRRVNTQLCVKRVNDAVCVSGETSSAVITRRSHLRLAQTERNLVPPSPLVQCSRVMFYGVISGS